MPRRATACFTGASSSSPGIPRKTTPRSSNTPRNDWSREPPRTAFTTRPSRRTRSRGRAVFVGHLLARERPRRERGRLLPEVQRAPSWISPAARFAVLGRRAGSDRRFERGLCFPALLARHVEASDREGARARELRVRGGGEQPLRPAEEHRGSPFFPKPRAAE
jgi:hypothetical protein